MLFLDIVGSTEIAVELQDDRWRAALARFRQIVRTDLKTHGGHEEDTAGDGFFATFGQPASAIRCAAYIVRDVQSIGIDVRCGVHVGELGAVDGHPGGVAVVVAARVMALGGPAEILCTATVRELVLGSGIEFASRGTEPLKGVPGSWEILTVSGTPDPLPEALGPGEARERLAAVQPQRQRRKRLAVLGLGAVAVMAIALVALTAGHHKTLLAPLQPPPSLLRIDGSNRIVQTLEVRPEALNAVIGVADGTFWQQEGNVLIGRRVEDGSDPLRIQVSNFRLLPTFGFGSAWLIAWVPARNNPITVTRYDDRSGRQTPAPYTVPGHPMFTAYDNAFGTFVAGPTGVWYLHGDSTRLSFIDPVSNKVTGSWATGAWDFSGPTELLPTARAVWLCDPLDTLIKRFDVATHQVSAPISTAGSKRACPVAVIGRSVWVLDGSGAWTLTQIDSKTGTTLSVRSIRPSSEGVVQDNPPSISGLSTYALGSLWFPAGRVVYRYDLASQVSTTIDMPAGVTAGSVVADEPSRNGVGGQLRPELVRLIPTG